MALTRRRSVVAAAVAAGLRQTPVLLVQRIKVTLVVMVDHLAVAVAAEPVRSVLRVARSMVAQEGLAFQLPYRVQVSNTVAAVAAPVQVRALAVLVVAALVLVVVVLAVRVQSI